MGEAIVNSIVPIENCRLVLKLRQAITVRSRQSLSIFQVCKFLESVVVAHAARQVGPQCVSQDRYRCADLQAAALAGISKDLVSRAGGEAPGQLVRPHPHSIELGDIAFTPRYNTRRKTEYRFKALLDDEEVLPSGQKAAG